MEALPREDPFVPGGGEVLEPLTSRRQTLNFALKLCRVFHGSRWRKIRGEVNGLSQNHPLDIDLNLGSRTGFWRWGWRKLEQAGWTAQLPVGFGARGPAEHH